MTAPDMFPYNYFATEVAAPRRELSPERPGSILEPSSERGSLETDETAHSQHSHGPELDASSSQTQGQVQFNRCEGLPTAKPSRFEKMRGTLEKASGEYWNNPYLIEKGELRRSGVLAARKSNNCS